VLAVIFLRCFREQAMTKLAAKPHFDLHLARGFFDAETCRRLIAELHRSRSTPAITYGEGERPLVDERVRKASQLMPSRETVAQVTRRLNEHRQLVGNHFGVTLRGCEEPQFLCYRVGDFFVAHQDGNTGLVRIPSDKWRRVSVSIFLNHQSQRREKGAYCGGSLVFSDWRSSNKSQLAGEAGTMVAFRSEVTHEVTPVTYGERYSIVAWYG